MSMDNCYLDTSPFWKGAEEQKLVLQVCLDTGKFQHPPRPISMYTGSGNIGWRQASGEGSVVSSTNTVLACGTERIIALVDLDVGVRILSWITGALRSASEAGPSMRVVIDWQRLPDGRKWPAFKPRI